MHEQTGALAAVTFGYFDEDEDGDTVVKEQPGTFTLPVTDLPDDMEWSAGMPVTINPAPKEQS